MEAAAETDSLVIMQPGWRPQVRRRRLPEAPDPGRRGVLPAYPRGHARDHANAQGLPGRHRPGLLQRHDAVDGSLKEDGKTIADYDYNVEVTKKSRTWPTSWA